jgi:hypothetical protein
MSHVTPFARRVPPETVGAFLDARGGDRALRVTWHHEPGSADSSRHGPVVLLSMWRGDECAASFRLPIADVPDLIEALRRGLDEAYDEVTAGFSPRSV